MSSIYIIDDEVAIAELISLHIQSMSLASHVYTSGQDFFYNNDHIDHHSILILDLKMPGLDGIEVIRLLAEKKMSPALILMSGYDTAVLHSAEQLAQAHNLNVIGSLVKPVNCEKLQQFVAKNIADKSENRAVEPSIVNAYVPDLEDIVMALQSQQLVLHFQPQINIKSQEVIGAEALVRWQHPEYGLIYPDRFIPIVENNGLMDQLTTQVINLAIQQIGNLLKDHCIIPISVNVSAENISSLSLPEYLTEVLRNNQLDPTMLILEITETALMGELVTSLDILTRLRMKGFDLSIDDFGTGYSSLSHLHRIPFTELKIDQSFIKNMERDEVSRAIAKTCILLGHELGMSVVAEGVETKGILDELLKLGCDNAQGYHIARPMPAEQFMQWLKNTEKN